MTRASNFRRHSAVTAASAVFGTLLALGSVSLLTGCPQNPYQADTWIAKLDDKAERARAVTELDRLGDPKAIPALAKAWEADGRDPKILDVIIAMAKPFTPDDVQTPDKQCRLKNDTRCFMLRDFPKGRPASWDKAMPVLVKVLTDVDDLDDRWRESAGKAADAIGESKDPAGIDILIETVNRKMNSKADRVRLSAIIALGKFKDAKAVAALSNVLRAEPGEQEIAIFGAAINALADLRSPEAVPVLLESMYRLPPLFGQIRRALAASGSSVGPELQKVLRGESTAINTLFTEKKLGIYCGDDKAAPRATAECDQVSAKDYYAAVVLGDLYDAAAVPDLLVALKRPALPVYYSDDTPAALNQHQAIYQALQKIGSPAAAADIKAIWSDAKATTEARSMALATYPLVARDANDVDALVAIAEGQGDEGVRVQAALAFAGLATNDTQISVLSRQADKYTALAAEQRAKADAVKPAYDTAKAAQDAAKKAQAAAGDASKVLAAKALKDKSVSTDDLKASADAATAAKVVLDKANEAFKTANLAWKPFDDQAKGYRASQRFFQTQIARVELAVRCKTDGACYAATLPAKPEDFEKAGLDKKANEIAGHLGAYVKDLDQWSVEEKRGLVDAQIDRAMVELGKMGNKASDLTPALLVAAATEASTTRGAILLALPKVAKVPCKDCEIALDKIIANAEGKSTLTQLTTDTQMVRNYFSWAGN